jgi:tRNA pseudouridine55 synthase
VKNTIPDFPLLTHKNFRSSLCGLIEPATIPHFFDSGAVLLVDKPVGWTSFDVVNKIRNLTRAKKVGHCGTLDPFASGLLILSTGRATQIVDKFSGLSKTYWCEFELGKTTDTFDCEGKIIAEYPIGAQTIDELRSAAAEFTGDVEQVPPAYSAIKVGGVAAYKLARKGKPPELKPRQVTIHRFEILSYEKPYITARIHCSKGTYIRAIARDFGSRIGCGAFVKRLIRESIGDFSCADALTIEQIKETIQLLRASNAHNN